MSLILTLDAGTTSLKGALFDLSGAMLCSRIREYHLEKPAPDIVELSPEVYWDAARSVIAEILREFPAAARGVKAVGVTSQGETLIVLDKDGRPLRKAIVWLDNRAREEAAAIGERFGRELVYKTSGQQDVAPCWPAAKVLWLRRREPEVFSKVAKFLMLEDYLAYRLTGVFATDHAMCPSTLYYDLRNGRWWGEMLEFLGISERQLPLLLDSGSVAGRVRADVGLSSDAVVTVSPIDQIASAVGAGNIAPGMATETTGCALAVCASVASPVFDPGMRVGLYRHAVPGMFALLPWVPTAGMALRWFRDEFGDGADYAGLAKSAGGVPPGCDGLLMLPHLCGMTSPAANPDARGVFYGITPGHGKAHFVRAILEAVAFSLRENLELLEELGADCREVASIGGAARSGLWLQIKADVLGRPLKTMMCEETTSLGAAMLAAAGSGAFRSLSDAAGAMCHPGEKIVPKVENKKIYDSVFHRCKNLNGKLFSV